MCSQYKPDKNFEPLKPSCFLSFPEPFSIQILYGRCEATIPFGQKLVFLSSKFSYLLYVF